MRTSIMMRLLMATLVACAAVAVIAGPAQANGWVSVDIHNHSGRTLKVSEGVISAAFFTKKVRVEKTFDLTPGESRKATLDRFSLFVGLAGCGDLDFGLPLGSFHVEWGSVGPHDQGSPWHPVGVHIFKKVNEPFSLVWHAHKYEIERRMSVHSDYPFDLDVKTCSG